MAPRLERPLFSQPTRIYARPTAVEGASRLRSAPHDARLALGASATPSGDPGRPLLAVLPELIAIGAAVWARKTRRVIRQNLAWALVYNLTVLPLAACGFVPPYLAAAGMSLSSLLVMGNALRLTAVKPLSPVEEAA